MTHFSQRLAPIGLALLGLSLAAPAQAQEADFLSRFEGKFAGAGSVSRNESENPTNVKCTMNGDATESSLSMSGSCRAAVIFSRKISADLKVDSSGRYTGTYVGSSIGPAKLSGKRNGDAVNLTITWPKEVRGDKTAAMTIQNSGNGQVSITIVDEIPAGGPKAQVSNIALSQS